MNMREGARGFSFCLPAPTAEKMATDVFFRDGSTIKEALVAFLMRHVNFMTRGAEERRSERLQPRKAKCLFAFNSDKALALSVSLRLHLLPHRRIKAGQGASNRRVRVCGCQSSTGGGKTQKHRDRGGIKVLEDLKTRSV